MLNSQKYLLRMVRLVMNKFQPIFILLFSIVLVVFSIVNLELSNNKLVKVNKQNKKYLKIATKYKRLQEVWGKENNSYITCKNILRLSNIQNASISTSSKIMKIKIENAKITNLNQFMNKLLNDTIIISSFVLTKDSLILEVEI